MRPSGDSVTARPWVLGQAARTGWDPVRIAKAWVVLMERLGYTRYVAQGGDWGNAVTEQLALLKPEDCWAFTPTCQRLCHPTFRRRSPPAVPSQTVSRRRGEGI